MSEDLLYRLCTGDSRERVVPSVLSTIQDDYDEDEGAMADEDEGAMADEDEGAMADEDEVFLEDQCDGEEALRKANRRHSSHLLHHRHECTASWSLGHHCVSCQWAMHHQAASPPLVTLESLSAETSKRDSGYVASPTSGGYFSYSSDDDSDDTVDAVDGGVARRRDEEEPIRRARTRSCPEIGNLALVPRTPVPRYETLHATATPLHPARHSRNWSTPVTGPDGSALLAPPSLRDRTPSSRSSREGLIDLTEDEQGVSCGHRRRVLVLALPDLVADAQGSSPAAVSSSSSEAPSPLASLRRRAALRRPAWTRPRALSCDVTLPVEVGLELRRIADDFQRTLIEQGETERNNWFSNLRESIRARFRPTVRGSPLL